MSFWTSDRVETLRQMVAAKHTVSSIAVTLGCTRNAVISKTDRLGIGAKGGVGSRRGVLRQYIKRDRQVSKPKPPHIPNPESLSEEAMTATVTTLDLASHQCKWPVNEGRPFWLHCGQQQAFDSPYCEAHYKRAFNIQPKREKAA